MLVTLGCSRLCRLHPFNPNQQINNHLISFWQQLNVVPDCSVFVPLCGKSLDLLWLHQQGHVVLRIESSELAVNDFFVENGLNYS